MAATVRLLSIVLRKVVRGKPPVQTRIVPFIIEFSDRHNLTMDHVRTVCSTLAETEAATIAVQIVLAFLTLGKYRPKSTR